MKGNAMFADGSNPNRVGRCDKGFSLIELLIVVAIILIIASIAIPNLLRARIAANQAAVVGDLRTIASAEANFHATYNEGYTLNLNQLGGAPVVPPSCANAKMIDEVLGQDPATKSGYTFVFTKSGVPELTSGIPAGCPGSGDTGFSVSATPLSASSGTTSYCIDETSVIRYDTTGIAIVGFCSASKRPPLH